MDLSVVVPTLNGRDRLAANLDALAEAAPDAEVVVVNGPSADGTTGMVRDRDDVGVLVELSDRTLNVSRNAGIQAASGDAIAFVRYDVAVEDRWLDGVTDGLEEAAVVTGPSHQTLRAGMTTETLERRTICGRDVTYFNGGNVAFHRDALDELDGFDEYLKTGGARDAAHRLAGAGYDVTWRPEMSVRTEYEADGGVTERDWGWKYRALGYRLAKNYGFRPTVVRRTLRHARTDAVSAARDVVRGDTTPTGWLGTGRDVLAGMATGISDGLVARARDQSPTRNPHGRSKRADRAVATYDWR
ncbi:Glycosyltransferase involved in cell wall bisynthesis [Halogeometricum rufum]|uniref:Glycosyltransferase involved in cell wall bisynthesis n=1 Tax=Halogeometricum rufum TaxID=553469 RepID=A0A1I6GEK0_9EURY|nr:glycosyltransferase [Halogeometricum rufum]SFR40633.1 Glycosyltransferase involved in cell wall bisynthesis [Halogeometricum rufum]